MTETERLRLLHSDDPWAAAVPDGPCCPPDQPPAVTAYLHGTDEAAQQVAA